jgi:hypothetical protein
MLSLGCNSHTPDTGDINNLKVAESVNPLDLKNSVTDWQLVDSNEWFDFFELTITDSESLVCAAFHKTDAQLGIGIMFQIAILADDRGFKYFTTNEAIPTKAQLELLENKLPKSRVLESCFRIQYLLEKPIDSENHVFDVKFLTKIWKNQAEEFE